MQLQYWVNDSHVDTGRQTREQDLGDFDSAK